MIARVEHVVNSLRPMDKDSLAKCTVTIRHPSTKHAPGKTSDQSLLAASSVSKRQHAQPYLVLAGQTSRGNFRSSNHRKASDPCPPKLSETAIMSFVPALPDFPDSILPPAVDAALERLQKEYATAGANGQHLLRSMSKAWIAFQQISDVASGMRQPSPSLTSGPRDSRRVCTALQMHSDSPVASSSRNNACG